MNVLTIYNGSYPLIDALLKPKTVAILGASSNQNKLGFLQVQALLDGGFQGDIYPINPNTEEIAGLKCYESLSKVPKEVDLTIFCIRDNNDEASIRDAAKKYVHVEILFE